MKNAIVGYRDTKLGPDLPAVRLKSVRQIEVSAPSATPSAKLFVYPETTLAAEYCEPQELFVYIWGTAAHPTVEKSRLPRWCAKVLAARDFRRFQELLGCFVIIADDWRRGRLIFVTDVLGVRPLFFQTDGGRQIFGSHVWPMFQQGLTSREIDYSSVASWVAYGYNCNGGALFKGLTRLGPGRAVELDGDHRQETPYATFSGGDKLVDAEQAAEEIHEIVASTVKTMLAEVSSVSLPLSGGWDSRYLLALALSQADVRINACNVPFSPCEQAAARDAARRLGTPLDTVSFRRSVTDAYDAYFSLTVDGFPISRQPSYLVAHRFPGLPSVNGFLGDPLIRGTHDRIGGRLEVEHNGDLSPIVQRNALLSPSQLFKRRYFSRLLERSRPPVADACRGGKKTGKVFWWADLHTRQRQYMSNNFLQHLELAEPILPFMNYRLLSYKMEHGCPMFTNEVYTNIFRRYFPQLADVPHSRDLNGGRTYRAPIASVSMEWARNLLSKMSSSKRLKLLSRRWCIPVCLGVGVGVGRIVERTVHQIHRFSLFEEQMQEAGLTFDWEEL